MGYYLNQWKIVKITMIAEPDKVNLLQVGRIVNEFIGYFEKVFFLCLLRYYIYEFMIEFNASNSTELSK